MLKVGFNTALHALSAKEDPTFLICIIVRLHGSFTFIFFLIYSLNIKRFLRLILV